MSQRIVTVHTVLIRQGITKYHVLDSTDLVIFLNILQCRTGDLQNLKLVQII